MCIFHPNVKYRLAEIGITLVALVLLVAVGCGAAATATPPPPTPTTAPTPTAAPTPTPAPSPTAAPSPTPRPDLSAILRQHYDAVNKGDAAAAFAVFTEDAEAVRGGRCPLFAPCKGTAIQNQLQGEVRNEARFGLLNFQVAGVAGEEGTGRIEFRGVVTRTQGVDRLIWNVKATFRGDKIARLVHELDVSDPQTAQFSNFQRVAERIDVHFVALNRGDVAGAIALYSEDSVFEGWGLCAAAPCRGKAAIQKELERQVADKTTRTGISAATRLSGDNRTGRAEMRSESIKAAGVERVIVLTAEVVKGDRITSMRYELDTTDPQTATYLKVAILRQHYDAVNRYDAAGALALFTDDAFLVRGGCNPQAGCVGKAGIQLELGKDVGAQNSYNVIGIQVSGDAATGRVEFRNVNTKSAGLERVIENFTATFKGEKIARLVHELDLSDSQSAAFANFRRVNQVRTRYADALTLGNVAGAMAAVTDDAVFAGYGLCAAAPCAGKAAIQKEVERLVADKTKTTGIGGTARVTGDTYTSRIEVRSDSIKAAGVERIIVAATVEAKGDKVSLRRWVPDSTDPQTATYLKSLAK